MSYTPGPWDFYHDKKANMISIAGKSFDREDDSYDKSICGIWAVNSGSSRSDAEHFSNAQLISAAPELLEALEGVNKAFEISNQIADWHPTKELNDAFMNVLKVIEKAKGTNPNTV